MHGPGLLPADAEVAARRRRRSDRRVHRRRRQAGHRAARCTRSRRCSRRSPARRSTARPTAFPILKYEATIAGEVPEPGLGPLHTEFDGKGYAYTSVFISSEIVKWSLKDFKVVDRIPTYYSIGHLMIPGGDSAQAVRQVRRRAQQDHQGSLSADRTGAHAVGAALRDRRRQDAAAARLPDRGRAALRAGDSRLAHRRQAEEVLRARREPRSGSRPRARRKPRSCARASEVHVYMTSIRSHFTPGQHRGRPARRHRVLPPDQPRAGLGRAARLRDHRRPQLRAAGDAGADADARRGSRSASACSRSTARTSARHCTRRCRATCACRRRARR